MLIVRDDLLELLRHTHNILDIKHEYNIKISLKGHAAYYKKL